MKTVWTKKQVEKFKLRDALLRRAAQGWIAKVVVSAEPFFVSGKVVYIEQDADEPELFGVEEPDTEVLYFFHVWDVRSVNYEQGIMQIVTGYPHPALPEDWAFLYRELYSVTPNLE